jgi:hypothetical protein
MASIGDAGKFAGPLNAGDSLASNFLGVRGWRITFAAISLPVFQTLLEND